MAYSHTCAHLRTMTTTVQSVSGDMPGCNHRKMGTINRDVCSVDSRSVEPINITPSQITNRSQYFRKVFIYSRPSVIRAKIDGVSQKRRINPQAPLYHGPPKSLRKDLNKRPGKVAALGGKFWNCCANGHCAPPCTWQAAVGTLSAGKSMS